MKRFILVTVLFFFLFALFGGHEILATEPANTPKQKYASGSTKEPYLSNVQVANAVVGAYQMFEASFDLDADYDNPFDPDDIAVVATVVYPSGKKCVVPAFFMDPYESVTPDKTLLNYAPNLYRSAGTSGWRFRFASGEQGEHRFTLHAKDRRGHRGKTETIPFRVGPSDSLGFVRIAKDNPAYFENEADGSLFYGSGSNIAWVRQSTRGPAEKIRYEYFLDKAKGTTSATRVWLCHWAWLEWTPKPGDESTTSYAGLGFYNQQVASSLDKIFQTAEQDQLRIILCLDDNNEHYTNTETYDSWAFNPYNKVNGGPAEDLKAYWSNPDVRKHYKNRLRYILARWGYSPSLWTINLWNDMTTPNPDIVDYLDELCKYSHSVADGFRPLIFGSNIKYDAVTVLDYGTQEDRIFGQKPNVTNECYFTSDDTWFASTLQDEIWDGLVRGEAARLVWPHDVVDRTNSWPVFRRLLDFTSDLPLNKKKFDHAVAKVAATKQVADSDRVTPLRLIAVAPLGDVPVWGVKSPKASFDIAIDQSRQFIDGFCMNLWGERRPDWKNPPTFVIDMPKPGKMLVRIEEIGSGPQIFTAKSNGQTIKSTQFVGGRRELKESEQYIEVPLEKGVNRITLDNTGTDWMRLGDIYFLFDVFDLADLLVVSGRQAQTGDCAFFYIQNQTQTELYQKVLKGTGLVIESAVLTITGLKDGDYRVVVYDPSAGTVLSESRLPSSEGVAKLSLPPIRKDIAVKLY